MLKDIWSSWRMHMRIIFILLLVGLVMVIRETYKRGYRDGVKAAAATSLYY